MDARRFLGLGALVLTLVLLPAAAIRLYLTDGGYHMVREYQVKDDRVRYYSLERSEWEEIPLELVDLKRTEAETRRREEEARVEREAVAVEDRVEREQKREVARVPEQAGPYLIQGGELIALKQAESKVVSNKRRNLLRVITPIPIVAGKSTVELDGETSAFAVTSASPEFYFRLAREETFGVLRLKPNKGARIVQTWSIVPVTKEIIEEHLETEIFRQQVDEGLYKIWPKKPLEPGEYAVIEYTPGKANIQVWDFAWRPAGVGPAKKTPETRRK